MATLFRRPQAVCQCQRSFSTSSIRAVSLQWDKNDPEALAEVLPPYPYGPTRWYKQSRLGLYGGQRVQFGNNVSGDFNAKTRRTWHPNILTRKLFSKALNRKVQVRVSARVLRTIDKLGGLDEYLLGEKAARIKELGESGWWLRWAIMQTDVVKKRFAEERIRLGLTPLEESLEAVTLSEAAAEELAMEQEEAEEDGEELGSSIEDMEAVEMDDAFQIEQTEDLPPIKFRVGPGQHVMLTPQGWRRTRPDPNYFINKRKQAMKEKSFPDWVEHRVRRFEAELNKRERDGSLIVTDKERKQLVKATRKSLTDELQQMVDKMYERHMAKKAAAKAERLLLKREKKAAEKAAEAVTTSE